MLSCFRFCGPMLQVRPKMARHLYMLAALLSAAAALSGCQTVLLESHSDVSLGKPSLGRILVVPSLDPKEESRYEGLGGVTADAGTSLRGVGPP